MLVLEHAGRVCWTVRTETPEFALRRRLGYLKRTASFLQLVKGVTRR